MLSSLFAPLGNIYARGLEGILGPVLVAGGTFLAALALYFGFSIFQTNDVLRYILNAAPFLIPRLIYGIKAATGNMVDKNNRPIKQW